jgi:hypothetical protein
MPPGPRYGIDGPFLYPLPAVVLAVPLARLDVTIASAVFIAASTALMAFGLSAAGWWRLTALAAPPYVLALYATNWSPLILGAATIPWLRGLVVAKPNLGLMVFAAWPRWSTVISGALLLGVSLLLVPEWPVDWLSHVRAETIPHYPPLRWELGAVGLLGLLRWRTSEGRLLAAFTLTPVSVFPYDFLMLWLIPRTRGEMAALTTCAWLAAPVMIGIEENTTWVVRFVLVLGMVVPATVIVLRHPNLGAAPAWVDRATAGWPAWVRGRGVAS